MANNHIELLALLKTTGLPVAYSHFNDTQSLPFITFVEVDSANLMADNKVYQKVVNYDVEYYFKLKNVALEEQLEKLFNDNNIPFEVGGDNWIADENVFQRIYEIGVIINGK